MGHIIVEIMPKKEILDPQGKAIFAALERLGIKDFSGVRQGKSFQLEVEGPITSAHIEAARRAAAELLSNPVIEDVTRVYEHDPADTCSSIDNNATASDNVAHSHCSCQHEQEA